MCGSERSRCLDALAKQRAQINTLAKENRVWLDRYRSLYRYKAFSEIGFYRLDIPFPELAGPEHKTVLAQIGLEALDGNVETACAELVRDTAYWRRVLAGASTLVTKTVAAGHLSSNYGLASEIVARYGDRATSLSAMTEGLTADETSWEWPLRSEFQWLAHLYASVPGQSGHGVFSPDEQWWDCLLTWVLYRPNATINLQYHYFEDLQALTDAGAHELVDVADALQKQFEALVDPFRADMVYNPVGKILVATATPSSASFARYIARSHNLEGQVRLLRLQMEITKNDLSITDIGTLLEEAPADLRDPYINEPFRWDPSSRSIWFEGIDAKSGDRLAPDIRIQVQI